MLSETDKKSIEQGFLKIFIIWCALLFSLIFYLVIAHLIGDEIRKGTVNQMPMALFSNTLVCISIVQIIIIVILRKKMLSKPTLKKIGERNSIASEQLPIITQYTLVTIISSAIAETIGIYGLVLYLFGGNINLFYGFLAVSAVLMIIYRPKKDEIIDFATTMNQGH